MSIEKRGSQDTMVLYHCVSARSFRPLWALEELGVDYRLVVLPFPPRALQKSYFEVNPLGTVPALVEGAVTLTESVAICEYLASRYGAGSLGVGVEESDYPRYLNWLHFGEATLTFPQTLVLRYGRFEPEARRNPQVVNDYVRWFLARTRGVAEALAGRQYLCAGRFTAADISVGYALMLASHIDPIKDRIADELRRYWQGLAERDGFQRSLAAQETAAKAQGVDPTPAPLAGG